MHSSYDIDGKRANAWPAAKFQFKKLKHTKSMSSIDLFNSIKNNIEVLVKTLYSNKDDKKIRNIVDLILLRSKLDFENLDVFKSNESSQQQSFIESIKKIYDDIVKQHEKDIDYEDVLHNAINKLKNALKNAQNSDSYKKSKDEDDKQTIDLDNDNDDFINVNENEAYGKIAKRKSYSLDDSIKILNDCIDKTNDLICTISASIDEQFVKFERMLMSSGDMMYGGIMSVLGAINGIQPKQLSYIQQELKNVKMPVFKDKQNTSKKKMNNTIQVYGMNIDTSMIDTLSSKSQKTILMIAVTIKKHYQKICMPLANIFAVVKGNAKYTIELINDIFQEGFDYWIRRIFGKIQKYVEENIIKPLKKLLLDYIKSKVPDVFKRLNEILNAIIELAKGAWKLIKGVFKLIWRLIKKIFTGLIRGFVKIMKFMFRGVIKVLKAIWRLIVLALKALWQLVRWAGRGLLKTWNWFKNTEFAKKTRRFFHKLTSPFRWMRDKVVNGVRHLRNGVRAIGRGISRGINAVKTGTGRIIRGTGRFIGRQFAKVSRVFGRMIPNFARNSFKRSIKLLKKIPLKRFFKWMGFKLARMMARKQVKKKAKEGLIKKIAKSVLKFAQKLITKKVISKTISAILSTCMWLWTLHDLWEGYKWLKKNLETVFREVGPPDAPDVTQPFWFENWIWNMIKNRVQNYIKDPKQLAEDIGNILKAIWEMLVGGESSKVINERRKQEWVVYAGTYHSFNNTMADYQSQSYNERNFNDTNGYPTYFDPSGLRVNILRFGNSPGILPKIQKLYDDRGAKKTFSEKWKIVSNALRYGFGQVIRYADLCDFSHKNIAKFAMNGWKNDDNYISLFARERQLLKFCAAMGITENIIIREVGEPSGMLDTREVKFYIDYIQANNEAVNGLRMLDYIEHMDEIKKVMNERLSTLRNFFDGKNINLKYVKEEYVKLKEKIHDFAKGIYDTYQYVNGEITVFESKCDEIEDKLGAEDETDLDNDFNLIISEDMYEGSEYY